MDHIRAPTDVLHMPQRAQWWQRYWLVDDRSEKSWRLLKSTLLVRETCEFIEINHPFPSIEKRQSILEPWPSTIYTWIRWHQVWWGEYTAFLQWCTCSEWKWRLSSISLWQEALFWISNQYLVASSPVGSYYSLNNVGTQLWWLDGLGKFHLSSMANQSWLVSGSVNERRELTCHTILDSI